jgi:TP901 family phage tail tape measure protein
MFKDAFSPGFTQAQNSFAGMKRAIGEINDNSDMNKLAAEIAMMTSMTEPFRRGLSDVLDEPSRLAGTFESSMKNIRAITGLSAAEAAKLGNELQKIGMGAEGGPLAVADAYNNVAGGITNLEAQMPVLNNAIALAEAGQASLGTATNGLVKIMNSYNFTASQAATASERISQINERAAWASDVLTQAVGMGVGSMEEFISSIAPVSGMASAVGVGLDEIGSTMAYMTATTDTANTAGTKLQAFMVALQRPSESLAGALKKIGITSGSAMLAEYGLAESARIVSNAFGGNQDAMVQAMGRMEAVKAIMSLTGDTYGEFAQQFGESMKGITETARAIQVEAYESKIARLNAATDALKTQIGGPINTIKGFFVDMGTAFLTHVVGPIVSSPVGGVFRGFGAVLGLGAKTALDLGSTALTTASQLAVLTATVSNAGGMAKLFKQTLSLLSSPLKGIGSAIAGLIGPLLTKIGVTFTATAAESGYAAAMWAAAGATWAALWPVLAVIAAVALLAGGAYLLVKHWDKVTAFFKNLWNKITGFFTAAWEKIREILGGVPNWALGLVAVFFPFIGVPLLIVKNWNAIPGFFSGLWNKITGVFSAAFNVIKNLFNAAPKWVVGLLAVLFPFVSIPLVIVKNWNAIPGFFSGLWNKITGVFSAAFNVIKNLFNAAPNWVINLLAVLLPFVGIPLLIIKNWDAIPGFFSGLWTGITEGASVFAGWMVNLGEGAASLFTAAWGHVSGFFSWVWTGITEGASVCAGWMVNLGEGAASLFIAAWEHVSGFFSWLWESIKTPILDFLDWFSPVTDVILAPFRAIGWVMDKVGGMVKGALTDIGTDLAVTNTIQTTTALAPAALASPAGESLSRTVQSPPSVPAALPATPAFSSTALSGPFPKTATMSASPAMTPFAPMTGPLQASPVFNGGITQGPVLPVTGMTGAGSQDMAFTASSAFLDAVSTFDDFPAWPVPSYDEVSVQFPQAMAQAQVMDRPARDNTAATERQVYSITIQHLTINADEIEEAVDIYKIIRQAAFGPEGAPA